RAPGISWQGLRRCCWQARTTHCRPGPWVCPLWSGSCSWLRSCTLLPEKPMPKTETNDAPFSYNGLDRVIHEKARLGLLTSLKAHPRGLAFADLKQLCGLTDGNLSRHLQVLQEAGLVEVTKGYEGNRPHT